MSEQAFEAMILPAAMLLFSGVKVAGGQMPGLHHELGMNKRIIWSHRAVFPFRTEVACVLAAGSPRLFNAIAVTVV